MDCMDCMDPMDPMDRAKTRPPKPDPRGPIPRLSKYPSPVRRNRYPPSGLILSWLYRLPPATRPDMTTSGPACR